MTPNLRLDQHCRNLRLEQHCRVSTALGQQFRDLRDKMDREGYKRLTLDEIHDEIRQRRGERELERMV